MKPQLITCGWCHERAIVNPQMPPEALGPEAWEGPEFIPRYAVFQCEECHGRMIAQWDAAIYPGDEDSEVEWFPKARSTNEYPGVPSVIADTARESWKGYENNLYRSAVTNARTVIEQIAKSHGYKQGGIGDKIISMVRNNVLPKRIKGAVTALKNAGNTMVHGDVGASITAVETETLLTVMDQMLEEVYVAPKRIRDLTEAVSGSGHAPVADDDEDPEIEPDCSFCDY